MNEDYARGKCPVCGCETMYRLNKNRLLYTFCRNGHAAKLGREESIKATAQIAGGNKWNNGFVYLYPINEKQEKKGILTNDRTEKSTTGTTGTNDTAGTGARAEFVQQRGESSGPAAGTSCAANTTTGTTGTTDRKSSDDGDLSGWL